MTNAEFIESKIFLIRGQKVMLDFDLALLYGVPTGQLNQQVKRNAFRFPVDFMFPLSIQEVAILKSQFVISSSAWGGRRKAVMAFTEHGVAMLSSVLNSRRAVEVNIHIVRTFVKLRAEVKWCRSRRGWTLLTPHRPLRKFPLARSARSMVMPPA